MAVISQESIDSESIHKETMVVAEMKKCLVDNISEEPTLQEVKDPTPPYSAFSSRRRSLILAIVTLAGFLGPVSGNIYIPILPQMQEVFNVSATTINGTVSVFMVVFAFAPLLWAPYADLGGRKTLYLVSLVFFILANILLASVPANIGALYVLRILQAFGASSVISVGAGTVADTVEPKHRGKAISYFMLGPQLGPILGPILSSIAVDGHWRWIFGFLAIFATVVYSVILFFLPETLRYLVGNGDYLDGKSWIVKPKLLQKRIVEDTTRFPKPPKPSLLGYWKIFKYKPVLLCSINGALLFATFYAMTVSFSSVLTKDYGFTQIETSVSYICPGISLIAGSISGGRISDAWRARIIHKNPDKYVPEHRFSLQIFGLILSMCGIIGYGWCVDKHVHVASLFVFTFLGGFGMTWVFITSTTYLTECSSGQPATLVAIGNFFRNIAAAVSAALVDKLIQKMGFGWCMTGLGFVNLIGVGLVLILVKYGPTWRHERK